MTWLHGDQIFFHVTHPDVTCELNGVPVTWALLEEGDVLRIGGASLRVASMPV